MMAWKSLSSALHILRSFAYIYVLNNTNYHIKDTNKNRFCSKAYGKTMREIKDQFWDCPSETV